MVDNINRPDALQLLQEKLPSYVVNCFIATGFDDVESIVEMDLGGTSSARDSISVIEQYIDQRKVELPNCMGPSCSSTLPFEFPPGHKIRIKKFIQYVKSLYGDSDTVEDTVKHNGPKKRKVQSGPNDGLNIPTVKNDILKRISSWLRKFEDGKFMNEPYEVIVTRTTPNDDLVASIWCGRGCGKSFVVQRVINSSTQTWMLSNWTKHFKKCVKAKFTSEAFTLPAFFSPSPEPMSSLTSTGESSDVGRFSDDEFPVTTFNLTSNLPSPAANAASVPITSTSLGTAVTSSASTANSLLSTCTVTTCTNDQLPVPSTIATTQLQNFQ